MQDRWLRAAVVYCKHGLQKSSPLEYGTVVPPICRMWRWNLCTVNPYVSRVQHFVPTSDIYVSITCLIYFSSHDEEDGRLVVWGIASVSSHLPLPPLSTAVGTERVSAVISTYQCGLTTKLFVLATSYGRATLGAKDVAKNFAAFFFGNTNVGVHHIKDVGLLGSRMLCCKYGSQMYWCVGANRKDVSDGDVGRSHLLPHSLLPPQSDIMVSAE